jgi:hypothetical protein
MIDTFQRKIIQQPSRENISAAVRQFNSADTRARGCREAPNTVLRTQFEIHDEWFERRLFGSCY